MSEVIEQILYSKDNRRFRDIEQTAKTTLTNFCGDTIIRDRIFNSIRTYAKIKDLSIEILRYPIQDNELWAFTFLKKGVIFVCINTALSVCKQIFAAAHEFYHIICYVEDTDQSSIRNGSMLRGKDEDEIVGDQEEIEANAFAGLLLMPTDEVDKQLRLLSIDGTSISIDDVLYMMDIFAIPYKACVLRLLECGKISAATANKLYSYEWSFVHKRMMLTGKAKRWNLNGKGTEVFGSLLENFDYNLKHELLTNERIKSDSDIISRLKDEYQLDEVEE